MVYYNLLKTIGDIYYPIKKNKKYIDCAYYNKKCDEDIVSLLGLLDVFIENSIDIKYYLTKDKYNKKS